MIIGVPKEIKDKEFRVGVVPAGVKSFTKRGHTVLVETNAGTGSGIFDEEYQENGATIISGAEELYKRSDMIIKVKEPLEPEFPLLRPGLILYTYLHLAPLPKLTDLLLEKKIIGIGYETVRLDNGFLPLLAPMSEVAGRMSIQVGAHFLEREQGGRGILLGGVPGVSHGHVTILGSGTVGSNGARIALAMGASVTVFGRNRQRLADLENLFAGRLNTLISSRHNIEEELKEADLVIGAVLLPGKSAPRLITREMLSLMKKGSVIVDVAIDQGGCAETSRPTSHSDPVFTVDGVIHYCVANMPGAVPRTSTFALTGATLPLALEIADKGVEQAANDSPALARGINVYLGKLVSREVAESQDRKSFDLFKECLHGSG